jgi:hypothetical protein
MEIRVTRPELYLNCGNLDRRDGHYFGGTNIDEAIAIAFQKYPSEVLDIQSWHDENHGRYLGRFKLSRNKVIKLPETP